MASRPAVFLSASFPDRDRGAHFPESDPAELADAVTHIAREVLRRGALLVSGGHPTITPLLLYVCAEYHYRDALSVFQSEHFRDSVPDETWRLSEEGWGTLHFTESMGDREQDLRTMRTEMLTRTPPVGAVFIGGMEGIPDEFQLVHELAPHAQRFPLVAPGGAAATIAESAALMGTINLSSRRYPVLSREIADSLDL